jgi:regulator of nucleoside diphosphate kinase
MRNRNVTTAPNGHTLFTQQDYDRLIHLLESPRYRATPGAPLMALRAELGRGQILPGADAVPKGVVTMHSRVRVRDPKGEEASTYTLVYPDEADIDAGKLSVLAPLGAALLGARVGQVVRFDTPGGVRRLRVERILYQPEAAGDFHL